MSVLARLNGQFRIWQLPMPERVHMSSLAQLNLTAMVGHDEIAQELLRKLREYDRFQDDNRDSGRLEVLGHEIKWSTSYLNQDQAVYAHNPTDPKVKRLLRVSCR